MKRCSLVIFDVCGTLYRSNTTFDFISFYWRKKKSRWIYPFLRLSRTKAGKIAWVVLSKIWGRELFRSIAIRTLAGQRVHKVDEAAQQFVKEVLAGKENPAVFSLLETQRASGCEVLLVSASIAPVIKAIANELDVDGYFCSTLEEADGRYLGRLQDDLKGRKKEVYWNKLNREKPFMFVTDNKEDLPLLHICDQPYVVVKTNSRKFWDCSGLHNAVFIEVSA